MRQNGSSEIDGAVKVGGETCVETFLSVEALVMMDLFMRVVKERRDRKAYLTYVSSSTVPISL